MIGQLVLIVGAFLVSGLVHLAAFGLWLEDGRGDRQSAPAQVSIESGVFLFGDDIAPISSRTMAEAVSQARVLSATSALDQSNAGQNLEATVAANRIAAHSGTSVDPVTQPRDRTLARLQAPNTSAHEADELSRRQLEASLSFDKPDQVPTLGQHAGLPALDGRQVGSVDAPGEIDRLPRQSASSPAPVEDAATATSDEGRMQGIRSAAEARRLAADVAADASRPEESAYPMPPMPVQRDVVAQDSSFIEIPTDATETAGHDGTDEVNVTSSVAHSRAQVLEPVSDVPVIEPSAGPTGAPKLKTAALAAKNTEEPALPYPDAYLRDYKVQVFNQVARQYSARASSRTIRGTTVVVAVIAPNGDLIEARPVTSSGNASADRRAVEAVRQAAPFAPLPRGAGTVSVRVPVTFGRR
jgi:TonB family protein